jgi:hypothetical protein
MALRRAGAIVARGRRLGAEIAALECFTRTPAASACVHRRFEVYGAAPVPAEAIVSYQGTDPQVGPLAKYTLLHSHADSP